MKKGVVKQSLPDMTQLLYLGTHSSCSDMHKTCPKSSQQKSYHSWDRGTSGAMLFLEAGGN